jgi:hypothetical protein
MALWSCECGRDCVYPCCEECRVSIPYAEGYIWPTGDPVGANAAETRAKIDAMPELWVVRHA